MPRPPRRALLCHAVRCAHHAERTLEPNPRSFWSSRGAATPDEGDFLLYRLSSPLCLVQYVQLQVFRALYQFG